jgi:hypothetical protein
MRENEKFVCSNVECDHVDFTDGECPTCGGKMEKIKGDEFASLNDESNDDASPEHFDPNLDDDPDLWYRDSEESWA